MMGQEQKEPGYVKVPDSWPLCFRNKCPKKDECLHYLVATNMADMPDTGPAVYPTVPISEQGCRLFTSLEPRQMAWGFRTLFKDVKSKDEKTLRLKIKAFLGSHASYYRYNDGRKLLTPEQQDWIINLFQESGYSESLAFDHYVYALDFEH